MNSKPPKDSTTQVQSEINSQIIVDFLGLSPYQMHFLLYGNWDDVAPIISINDTFDNNLLSEVPIVKKVSLLIRMIGEVKEEKATKNGNLSKRIVNALYESPLPGCKDTIASEEYAPSVKALRHAVTDCGWIKIRNQKFSLTKKGQKIFEKGFTSVDYVTLLKYWLRKYDWSFTDGHPECAIVQQSALFSLYVLRETAKELSPSKDFTKLLLKALPAALALLPEGNFHRIDPEERLSNIVELRFLDRFAAYFGLIDYVLDESLPYFERPTTGQVRTTSLFSQALLWFSGEEDRVYETQGMMIH